MIAAPEKFTAVAQANLEAMQTLTQAAYTATERLAALNLNTARSALEESAASVRTLLAAKDLQGLMGVQALAQPAIERTTAYWRAVSEIWTDAQKEFTKVLGAELAEIGKTTAARHPGAAFAPFGADVISDAVNATMAATSSVMERMTQAAEKLTEMTRANVAAATEATTKGISAVAAHETKTRKSA